MVVKVKTIVAFLVVLSFQMQSCAEKLEQAGSSAEPPELNENVPEVPVTGAERTEIYLPMLRGKQVAAIVNHTSMIGTTHLVDSLLSTGVNLVRLFAPEHGFRGEADAGEKLKDGRDEKTGLPLISLYGEKRKPGPEDLQGIDVVLFDIQDVGARFYTYIHTMNYVMEACAENDIPLIILDRPNPNGHYVDGPVLDTSYRSFVGLQPTPVVHGMTVGEYAGMLNGEGWLANGAQCDLTVVQCENYDHQTFYELPVRPSPNLPNMRSIYLYPSICYFEGTNVSVGRGTNKQFQVLGAPGFTAGDYSFTPVPMPGAKNPKHEGVLCRGYDLTSLHIETLKERRTLDLSYLVDFYRQYPDQDQFFWRTDFFDRLAGGDSLRKMLVAGRTEAEIRASWEPALGEFKRKRSKYLLYD